MFLKRKKTCVYRLSFFLRDSNPNTNLGDHFRFDAKENGDHFGVNWGIISGLGIIYGSGSFRGL